MEAPNIIIVMIITIGLVGIAGLIFDKKASDYEICLAYKQSNCEQLFNKNR